MSFQAIPHQFRNRRNQKLSSYHWKPSQKPRALLLISHGITEHCMLYDALGKGMAEKGFFVFGHDHVGHGHSEGPRAQINNIRELVEDSVIHIRKIRQEYPDAPLFICGHSLGGAVAIFLSLDESIEVKGMVLVGPATAHNPETATLFTITVAKLLSALLPQFPLVETDYTLATRSQSAIDRMNKDELRFHGYWTARTIASILQVSEEIIKRSVEIKVPFLLLHGESDKICHVDGSKKFFELAISSDKTMKTYPGGYHSLLYEPDGIAEDTYERIVKWLDSRVGPDIIFSNHAI